MDTDFAENLQAVVDSDEAYALLSFGTWMAGGCVLLAESLHRLIPGSTLWIVGRCGGRIPDHVVVGLRCGGVWWYLDYNGLQSESELLSSVAAECFNDGIGFHCFDETLLGQHDMLCLRDHVPALTALLSESLPASALPVFTRARLKSDRLHLAPSM